MKRHDLHDAHYGAFVGYKFEKALGGKTIHDLKLERIEIQNKQAAEWRVEYPQIGDRVIFRSVDMEGNIYDGYGYVQKVHVHDYRTGYALYTVKLEDIWDDEQDIYQTYCNHPDQKDKEWIRRA